MTVTISGSTGVAVPLGSVSAPGVSNTTSSTTGIYNPTGTTLAIATNGTQAVSVDASQNVGIGTSSPSNVLDVNGISRFRQEVQFNPSGTIQSRIGISTYSGSSAVLSIGNDSGATANTIAFYNTGAERMRIDSSGNVQVGGTTVGNTAGYVNSRTNARAWVNFNGASSGTITPRANYNISSVTKNGTGDYTLNFTTALADSNYVYSGSGNYTTTTQSAILVGQSSSCIYSTTALQIFTSNSTSGAKTDPYSVVSVIVFGN